MSFRFGLTLITAAVVALPAAAETATTDASVSQILPRLDIGVSTGVNNPGGIYGIETAFRLIDHISLGVAAGNGAWGLRLSPLARVYPFGASDAGLFIEGGASFNFGGSSKITINGSETEFNLAMTPVVNAAIGWRIPIARVGWLAFRAGYGFKLLEDNVKASVAGQEVSEGAKLLLSPLQPGGLVFGISGGAAVL